MIRQYRRRLSVSLRSKKSRSRLSLPESQVTPEQVYLHRRDFLSLGAAGALGLAGTMTAVACRATAKKDGGGGESPSAVASGGGNPVGASVPAANKGSFDTSEKQTPLGAG